MPTGGGQSLHFQQVFTLAERAGFVDRRRVRLEHAAFGVITGDDGRKFSSRRGTGAPLDALLDAAAAAAAAAAAVVVVGVVDAAAAQERRHARAAVQQIHGRVAERARARRSPPPDTAARTHARTHARMHAPAQRQHLIGVEAVVARAFVAQVKVAERRNADALRLRRVEQRRR